jgi:DNA invertase Pin-like site-specific DNA recombinase
MTDAIAYTRVSLAKQADEGVSLDSQESKIQGYCDLYDLELQGVETDEGESGKDMERPGLKAALDALEAGEATTLVVYKLDRLTRSVKDLGALLEDYFGEGQPYELVCVEEQVNTDSATGRLLMNILMSVSQWEREETAERTSRAMQHMQARGEYTGGGVPYGYQLGPENENGNRTLVEDAEEQKIIEAIKTYRDAGLTLAEVADRLAERGYTNRNDSQFNPATISRLSKREVS